MTKEATPSPWDLVAANEGHGELSPVAADEYWEDISLQASARLERLEDERKQHTVEDEVGQPPIRGRFVRRSLRLVLTVAVGAILFAAVAWSLKAVATEGLLR
jgi:hypothetical protein